MNVQISDKFNRSFCFFIAWLLNENRYFVLRDVFAFALVACFTSKLQDAPAVAFPRSCPAACRGVATGQLPVRCGLARRGMASHAMAMELEHSSEYLNSLS